MTQPSYAQSSSTPKVYKIFLNSIDALSGSASSSTFQINWRAETPSDKDAKWYIALESFHFIDSPEKFFDSFIYTMDLDRISKNIYSSKNGRTSSSIALIHGSDYQAYSSRFGAEIQDPSSLMLGGLTVSFVDTETGKLMEYFDTGDIKWSAVLSIYNYNT